MSEGNGNGKPAIAGLSADLIADLMASGRTRNAYGPKLNDFINSDEAAIDPASVWPLEFGKRESSTLYQGFMTAVKKAELSDVILVKQSDGKVYLLHKERVAGLLEV